MCPLVFAKESPVASTSVCLSTLDPALPAYSCLECMSNTTVMCSNCFFQSEHVNHLYWVFIGIEGHCDCGNTAVLLKKNCCRLHQGPDAEEVTFTPKQFHTYFSAASRSLANSLRWKIKPNLVKLQGKPLTLRSLALASLFSKDDEAFLMQNYNCFETLYARIANQKKDTFGNSFAARLCRDNHRIWLEFLLQDEYFRVLGLAVIQQMILEKQAHSPGVSTLTARVISESKAIPVFCQSGAVQQLMRCLSMFQGKIWKPAFSALYYLKPLGNPIVYVMMLRSNFLAECFTLYCKIVFEFKIVPSQLCENHAYFFMQFREHLDVIRAYSRLFQVAELTWIRTDADSELYKAYYIGKSGAEQITLPAGDYTNSEVFEKLVQLCAQVTEVESLFEKQQFVFLPNVLIHTIMLNLVLKVGVPAQQLIRDLAQKLECDWQMLLQFLCDTLLYSLVPLIKCGLGYFQQYQFELSTVLDGQCLGVVEKYYHTALRFLQLYLPLVTCKLDIFARHLDECDCRVLIRVVNMICFLPQQENMLKFVISDYALQTESFTACDLFEKFPSHRSKLKPIIDELFEQVSGTHPIESMYLRLRTTNYFEPALSLLHQDEILAAFQLKYSTSALIELAQRQSFQLDTKTLITPEIAEFFDDTYVNGQLPVSLRFAVLRLLTAIGYKSSNAFQSTDPLLKNFEKQVFCQQDVQQLPRMKLTARMTKLKAQLQDQQTNCLQIASPPPTQGNKSESDVCCLCHEAMGDDSCILLMVVQRHRFTFPHSCPHHYHASCCDTLGCKCTICGSEFQFAISRSSLRYFYSQFPDNILLDVDGAFLAQQAIDQIVAFKSPAPGQLMVLPVASFLFEKAVEATTKFATYAAQLSDINHAHKRQLISSLKLVAEQLISCVAQPDALLPRFPSEAEFSEEKTLVTKSVFPASLSTILRQLGSPIHCENCKTETKEWFISLKENQRLCMECAVATSGLWDVSNGTLILFFDTFHMPYRSVYGEIYKTMAGFEQHFDPSLLENIIFSTLTG